MTITFFSNFMNHHQLPFCNEMIKLIGDDFKFVATKKIDEDRLTLGYEDMNKKYPFIIRSYENEALAYDLALNSDVVIIGSAPDKYIRKRIKERKLVFRYSERVFKSGFRIKSFLSLVLKRSLLERNNVFLLCSSAYSAFDYNLTGAYIDKAYKWGYFPEVKKYKDINKMINKKTKNSLLWVGRFLDWKHPEVVIEIARKLKNDNLEFSINMIGIGDMYNKIFSLIKEYNLEDNVKLLGSMSASQVRCYMEKSQIFLFTSDRGEGWGAVLNEAMNSACSVIASHKIGSVPYLIKDNKNGLIYEDGNIDDLYNKVKYLLHNDIFSSKLGLDAYNTMITLWNPKVAAERFLELSNNLLINKPFDKYDEGPCSIAFVMKDNWYKNRKEV